MKLTQKVDHFTVFNSFPSTGGCSHKLPPNNLLKIRWLDVRGSIRDVFIGWVQRMDWQEKVTVQNCGRALVKPKNQPGGGLAGSLMPEIEHNQQCGCLGCSKKQQHWI